MDDFDDSSIEDSSPVGDDDDEEASQPPARKKPRPTDILPSPVRNQIAGVRSRDADPFFIEELTDPINPHKKLLLYKDVPLTTVMVNTADVLALMHMDETGPSWSKNKGSKHLLADQFRQWAKSSCLPPHVALSFDQSFQYDFRSKRGRGRKRSTEILLDASDYNQHLSRIKGKRLR
jgi:hypothetical protein